MSKGAQSRAMALASSSAGMIDKVLRRSRFIAIAWDSGGRVLRWSEADAFDEPIGEGPPATKLGRWWRDAKSDPAVAVGLVVGKRGPDDYEFYDFDSEDVGEVAGPDVAAVSGVGWLVVAALAYFVFTDGKRRL